jgi:hypothetical protein
VQRAETACDTEVRKRAAATAEGIRLTEDFARKANWKRWGSYLAERQWGTVREDYSASGNCWSYLPHDHARSRAYRWGEDGLLGFSDRECRLCFAPALWNGRDPILKERLFGLTNDEGNHGEDAKEVWFYIDSTPTHSYARGLYRYPQAEFPYTALVEKNRGRSKHEPEFEIADTGVFADGRYFDVQIEYAKNTPDDLLIRIEIINRGPEAADLHLLPTLWFRNTWSWGCVHEGCHERPSLWHARENSIFGLHETLGQIQFEFNGASDGGPNSVLFTENETNKERLYGVASESPYTKDAFHRLVIDDAKSAVNPKLTGTKAALWRRFRLDPGQSMVCRLRLRIGPPDPGVVESASLCDDATSFDALVGKRRAEADEFYAAVMPESLDGERRSVARQAYSGLLWSKQFYHYVMDQWLDGDPAQPPPPGERATPGGRNTEWRHLFARDIISMPDKWEYPWFAAWDLAFQMIPMARVDGYFAKQQLELFLREWYMHPNGQIPAYEFALGDVNPPVHAWAAWRVYKITGGRGHRDRDFLAGVFQKLLLNFTWWVNRKDESGRNLFSGGFLGLDNIGVFDRSKPLPGGGALQQADGTAWMAFYCSTMLAIALELSHDGTRLNTAYEDMASKFLEHFVQIAEAMNTAFGAGLWDEEDGFYYDQLIENKHAIPLKTRSIVGLLPLIAVEVLDEEMIAKLPGFKKRLDWFVRYKHHLSRGVALGRSNSRRKLLLAIPTRERLRRVLKYLGDENEFLSPYGLRSLSKRHASHPYVLRHNGEEFRVDYVPGDSESGSFGGNSNWRGPIWFPINYLIIEALERYHHFYGDEFRVEYPTGSGSQRTLQEIATDIEGRLASLFLRDASGKRPCDGPADSGSRGNAQDGLVWFHEYFHGETGRGLGANHQTGWTALVARCLEDLA